MEVVSRVEAGLNRVGYWSTNLMLEQEHQSKTNSDAVVILDLEVAVRSYSDYVV